MRAETSIRYPLIVAACLFALLAFCFLLFGLYTAYRDEAIYKIVEGDAYNFIIFGLRGLAWICIGIVSAIFALICAIIAKR